jgi:hypothetical protein
VALKLFMRRVARGVGAGLSGRVHRDRASMDG